MAEPKHKIYYEMHLHLEDGSKIVFTGEEINVIDDNKLKLRHRHVALIYEIGLRMKQYIKENG